MANRRVTKRGSIAPAAGLRVTGSKTARAIARAPKLDSLGTPAKAPDKLIPVLATLVDGPPPDPAEWVFEIKFDGYRMLTRIDGRDVRLITRNGNDWTSKLPELTKALSNLKLKSGWLDGEIVMPGKDGKTSFQALQNAFDSSRTAEMVYYLFDLPYYDGRDLRAVPLDKRRELLEAILKRAGDPIRFSAAFDAPPAELVASACKLGLEGMIGKRKTSSYSSRRSPDWIKLKCTHRQEFVIGGWTDPKGGRVGFGALLLGVYDEHGRLAYAGKVGTGFDDRKLSEMRKQFAAVESDSKPFAGATSDVRTAHWLKPKLVAEVSFSEWTEDGHLRHPVFVALRTDKPARAIIREAPVTPLGPDAEEGTPTLPANLRVTNPARVVDPSIGATKVEVLRYYASVGMLMMPHLKGRPVSLVRAPQGITQQLFFQKHLEKGEMAGIERLDPALDRDHVPLLEVATPLGLLSSAQMNVIEFHTWNAVKAAIDKPDRMTFDLDPGEGLDWPSMQQAATLMKGFLEQLGLPAFLKTSGGKGLHVVTPIRRQYGWDDVKDFSETIVQHMAQTLPDLFVAKSGPKNRVGRIFIDYLRNGFGATTAAAWSVRARPGLGISVPVDWKELKKLTGGAHWTLRNSAERLEVGNAPWADYEKSARSIGAAMKTLGFASQGATGIPKAGRTKPLTKKRVSMDPPASLALYQQKRDFTQTAEPSGRLPVASSEQLRFVIQKHAASHLHYDLRLELDGVFKSWAVTRGPSMDPAVKRLAVEVEDHPLDYGDFEGTIPKGQYGGGTVQLWDRGYWAPVGPKSAADGLKSGDFKFILAGTRLQGSWVLVRIKNDRSGGKRINWLLIKHKDEYAKPGKAQALLELDESVASGRSMEQIASGKGKAPKPFMLSKARIRPDAVWRSNREDKTRSVLQPRAGAKRAK
jgi:bifunctional non-homologous end joining protein LigD